MAFAELDFALDSQRIVDYVSAPAGSGKSHQAAAIAKKRAASGDLVLWAAPTKDVIDELVRKEFAPDQSCPPFLFFTAEPQAKETLSGRSLGILKTHRQKVTSYSSRMPHSVLSGTGVNGHASI